MSYTPTKELTDKLSKAKALLTLDHPFFATVLLQKPFVWRENIPTMAVDARGTIYLGPRFVEQLTVKQLIFGLAHECMHYMLLHPVRREWRKMRPWNWACDAVINDILRDANVGEDIPNTVNVPGAKAQKAEDLYNEDKDEGGGGMGDDLMEGEPLTEAEAREIEAQVKVEMAQARNVAKMAGKLPGSIERMVDEIINVPTPWHQILERFATSLVKHEQSWSRPNKRHLHTGIYLPGDGRTPKMGPMVVAVDTSGSVGGPELAEFAGHFNAIMDQCQPEAIHVVYCDAAVGSDETFTPEDYPARFTKVTGGGGTAFGPVFDWVRDNSIDPEALVYLTDGYGHCDADKPSYPTIWLTTGATEFPFGEVVEFKNK